LSTNGARSGTCLPPLHAAEANVVKSPASIAGVGTTHLVGRPEAQDRPLIAAEEKQLVACDRATQRPAELIAQQTVVLALAVGTDGGERALRVEPPVAQELEGVAVQRIGAGLRDCVH